MSRYDFEGNKINDNQYQVNMNYCPINMLGVFDNIVVIGDSLACGYTNPSGGSLVSSVNAKTRKANWVSYISNDINKEITNLGVGNTTLEDWRYGTNNANITSANITSDCYIVGLGVNDVRYSKTVGTIADIKSDYTQNANSVYGNMHYIISCLKSYNQNAKIFVFTNPGYDVGKERYNQAIIDVCNKFDKNVYLIDLDDLYKVDFNDNRFIQRLWHNGHFSPIAYRYFAYQIEKAISDYIINNPLPFNYIPYG